MTTTFNAEFVVNEKIKLSQTVCLLLMGTLAAMMGGAAMLDPSYPHHVSHGWGRIFHLVLEILPHNVAGWLLLIVAAVLLFFGSVLVYYWMWPSRVLVLDNDGIESLSEKGKGRLAWRDVMEIRQIDGVLYISGKTLNRQISAQIDDVDKNVRDIFCAMKRFRPDLV